MEMDDTIRLVADARRKEAEDKTLDNIGKYMITMFQVMKEQNSITNYKLNLHQFEAAEIEKYLVANYKLEAKKFLSRTGLSEEKIFNGEAEFEFYKHFCVIKAKLMSFETENKKKEQELKVKKHKKERNKKIVKIVGAVVLASGIAVGSLGLAEYNKDQKADKKMDEAFGMMVSDYNERDENNNDKRNIISQNEYRVGYAENGEEIIAYDTAGIANDILKICSKDGSLFDACIYNTYRNMKFERLNNIEQVWSYLKNNTGGLEVVDLKVGNSETFLEYTITLGCGEPTKQSHLELLNAIEEFKKTSDFNQLSEENQKIIKQHMKEYQKMDNLLYNVESFEKIEAIKEGENHGRTN